MKLENRLRKMSKVKKGKYFTPLLVRLKAAIEIEKLRKEFRKREEKIKRDFKVEE